MAPLAATWVKSKARAEADAAAELEALISAARAAGAVLWPLGQ